MSITWTKMKDAWVAERSDGAHGSASWFVGLRPMPGWTVSLFFPIGKRGGAWSGGGWFPSLAAAKKYLASQLKE